MSKLECLCGHTIIDQTNDIPYKGYILSDEKTAIFFDCLVEEFDSLENAIISKNRLQWIQKKFRVPPYPIDEKNSGMMHDLVFDKYIDLKKDIYECENCGRIAIQVGQTENFKFFKPDSGEDKIKIFNDN